MRRSCMRRGVFAGTPGERPVPRGAGRLLCLTPSHPRHDLERLGVMWGTGHCENDGGIWQGALTGMEYETADGSLGATSGVMVGGGDYTGYAFCFNFDGRQHRPDVDRWHGVAYMGQPPVPKPPAE